MKILALDQSSKISGWAVFNDTTLEEYGKINLEKYDDVGIRLNLLRQSVQKLIIEKNIDKVILEDIYMDNVRANNVQTFKVLSEVLGVLYELCIDMHKPVDIVLSGTWKATLGIKGKTRPEQKQNAQAYVLENYNIKPTQDEVDAICIGIHVVKKTEANAW